MENTIMFEFVEADIPSKARSGRTPLDNPFKDVFPSDGKSLSFVIEEGRNSLEARRAVRQVRQAAKAVGRTGRIQMDDLENGSVRFTVWTVDRIVRRK